MSGLVSYSITPAPLPWHPPLLKTLCFFAGIILVGYAVIEFDLVTGFSKLGFGIALFNLGLDAVLITALLCLRRGLEYAIGYFND